jgi:hypothetical protein
MIWAALADRAARVLVFLTGVKSFGILTGVKSFGILTGVKTVVRIKDTSWNPVLSVVLSVMGPVNELSIARSNPEKNNEWSYNVERLRLRTFAFAVAVLVAGVAAQDRPLERRRRLRLLWLLLRLLWLLLRLRQDVLRIDDLVNDPASRIVSML